nr:MAG TPA: hypothetical protein [Caudoviricetes sp.]
MSLKALSEVLVIESREKPPTPLAQAKPGGSQ